MRESGFIIDVPVTLSVAVRGADEETAKRVAREFASRLEPSQEFVDGYSEEGASNGLLPAGVIITEACLESNTEDACEVLDTFDEEED